MIERMPEWTASRQPHRQPHGHRQGQCLDRGHHAEHGHLRREVRGHRPAGQELPPPDRLLLDEFANRADHAEPHRRAAEDEHRREVRVPAHRPADRQPGKQRDRDPLEQAERQRRPVTAQQADVPRREDGTLRGDKAPPRGRPERRACPAHPSARPPAISQVKSGRISQNGSLVPSSRPLPRGLAGRSELAFPHPPRRRGRHLGRVDKREDVTECLHSEPLKRRVRRPGVDDVPAGADEDQRVADIDVRDRVRGEHHGPALVGEQPKQQHHPFVEARVEPGGRLVKEDDLRLVE